MTITAIIPFFRYEPVYQDNYKVLFEFFMLQLYKWANLVDEIIIIDSGCNFDGLNYYDKIIDKRIKTPIIIKRVPAQSHWQNMNEAVRMAKSDCVLLLDSDMIIYNENFIPMIKERMEKHNLDGCGIFDSSGSRNLSEYPLMRENDDRTERRRFAPYLFFLKKSALREGFDFTPLSGDNWTDSMGQITYDLLEDQKHIGEMRDDRSTISLEDDGRITSCQWLDSPQYLWSSMECPNLGYYHVRNFGGSLSIINNFYTNKSEFDHLKDIMPHREIFRLISWYIIMSLKTDFDQLTLRPIIEEMVEMEVFNKYFAAFIDYHGWLGKIS